MIKDENRMILHYDAYIKRIMNYHLFVTYLISYVFPITLETVESSVNGIIKVEKYLGHNRISVGGFWQSGEYATKNMRYCLEDWPLNPGAVKNILLLGVGGGSAIHLLNYYFPHAKIIGIDLDPLMIEMGKKYLHLNSAINIEYRYIDAAKYVKEFPDKNYFDIVLMDLFIGCDMPQAVQTDTFIRKVKDILKQNGMFTSNTSYLTKYQPVTNAFVDKVRKIFPQTHIEVHRPNLIIKAQA